MSDRNRLPYIDVKSFIGQGAGLVTKISEEVVQDFGLRDAKNVDFFTQYGAIGKSPGTSNILASVYTEASVAQPISWLGFYKAADLDGQILRHVIVAAGTALHRITGTAPSATLTALTGAGLPITESRTSGLFHTHALYDDFLLITNINPYLIGSGNTMVKYDGAQIQRWGVLAPGTTETVVETFADFSTFTLSGGTAANDTTTTKDGTAVRFSKTSTTQVNGDMSKVVTAFSVSTTIADRGRVSLYIPRGEIANFDQTAAVQVFVGSNGDLANHYYTFTFGIGELVEGWNDLLLDYSSPTATTGAPNASALNFIQLRVNSDAATDLISNIRWDQFIAYDTGAPTAANGDAAASSAETVFADAATYSYKVTYETKYGHSSNASPESATLTITSGSGTFGRKNIALTNIPVSSDPQVIARKIYRTVNGGTIHLFVATINDNETTTYTDTTTDTALGQTSPPIAGDLNDDNSPPPLGGIVKKWKRTVFISGDPAAPNTLYFSEDGEPESFPLLNSVVFDDRITGMYETYSGFVIETETGKWQALGDNPDFAFNKILNKMGNVGRRSVGETRIMGWSVDRDGMRLYDLNNPHKISEQIRDKFDNDFSQANMEFTFTGHSKRHNSLCLFVQDGNGDYTDNYVYQYPVDDIMSGQWFQLDLPASFNPQCIEEIEDSNGDTHLYVGDENGMIYELFDPDTNRFQLASGSTSAMTTVFTTKYFRLGDAGEESEGVTGRAAPRFIEIRHDGDATTWDVLIETAHGPNQTSPTSSATVSVVFAAGEDARRYPIPHTLQPGDYIRLTFTNNDTGDISSYITGFRLYYHVQSGQFPRETGQTG